jgi:hypothetical protein
VIPPEIQTAVEQTQVAVAWTATPIATSDPNLGRITQLLNSDLSATDPLGQAIDASYVVMDIFFQNVPESAAKVFVIQVRCICAREKVDCCSPARTFGAILNSMKKEQNRNQILTYLGSNSNSLSLIEIKVICVHDESIVGAMSAPWFDTKEYLVDNIVGYQYGLHVQPSMP